MTPRQALWRSQALRLLATRSPRERRWLLAAAVLLLLTGVLQLGIRPAWRTLQAAPQARAELDSQWQQMRALQAESAQLRQQPGRRFSQAELRRSLAPLGETARLEMGQGQAQLVLQASPPQALADWLVRARAQAGVRVRQAQLQRAQVGGQTVWNGTLTLELPP